MPSLAALLLATPVFGLSLQPPNADPMVGLIGAAVVADLHAFGPNLLQPEDEGGEAGPGQDSAEENAGDDAEAKESGDDAGYAAEIKRRNALIKVHRPLGLATWGAMTVTLALGIIQYYNLYGFFAEQGENPCVKGDAVFGQDQCSGTPWPHLIAAGVTTGLYAATFTVSLMMPDPDDLASGKGEFASTLRMHKLLRWIHFGGMLAQVVLGIVIANDIGGLDRANDYDTLQTLATVHLATGVITYGALTWAGALMTF